MTQGPWKLSPSDFAFLWEECKRCFYLKIVRGFERPHPTLPKIFNVIDSSMKAHYGGRRTETIAAALAPGFVEFGEKWVESRPIQVPGRASTCFVRGKFDTVVRFDDGSYGIVDFKTSERRAGHVPRYGRQLHAYAHALENPAAGKFGLSPISRLGLLVYEPVAYSHQAPNSAALSGEVSWIEVPRDDGSFLAFLSDVLAVLELPEPPDGASACEWCRYRNASRRTGL